ncbi:MAG: organomercurial lyase [Dehalococcoidia bacterium]
MPQNVPAYEFNDNAKKVRAVVFQFWCDNGYPPNLFAVHQATGLSRQEIVDAYNDLDLGIMCTVDVDSQNCYLLKAPPFSSYPTPVQVYIDGRFHSYAGCAMESVAISKMPPFAGKELRLESSCACCFEPISLVSRDFEMLSKKPESVMVHVSTSPRDWNKTNMVSMCDSMSFVMDARHAQQYEKQIGRLGVLFTIDQAKLFVTETANNRLWRYDWAPARMLPGPIIEGIRAMGVDVSNWGA